MAVLSTPPQRADEPRTVAHDSDAGRGAHWLWHPLTWILLAGAVVRLAVWLYWASLPIQIDDEQSYDQLAAGLLSSGTYVDGHGQPTSLRPPLYPAMLAGVYELFGPHNFAAARAIQAILSLLLTFVAYRLGTAAFSRRVGIWTAATVCFYPSFLAYNNLLLSETLFTLLVCTATWVAVEAMGRQSLRLLLVVGLVVALAALTRSIMMLFVPVLAAIVLCSWRGGVGRRLLAAAVPVAAFVVVIAPWSYCNSKLQGTFVTIDVMGGRNAMMGNYEHTPLERSWATISIVNDQRAWYHVLADEAAEHEGAEHRPATQGQLDKRALRHAVRFVATHPWLTLKRDAVKFFNFWQLEREVVAGARQGWFGDWPRGVLVLVAVAVCGSYALATLAGIFGLILAPPSDRGVHVLLVASIAFPCLVHTLIFAHSRYHLPVMPFVLMYAVSAAVHWRGLWARRRTVAFGLAGACCAVLMFGWLRELVFVDLAHAFEILG